MPRRIYPNRHKSNLSVVRAPRPSKRHGSAEQSREAAKQMRQHVRHAVGQGDLAHAIALSSRLIRHHAVTAEDFNNRGLIYLWNGQAQRAISDFDRAIALNPELPAAYNNRANCYAAQGDAIHALQDYEHTIDLDPFHIKARINRAITLRGLGCYDVALAELDEALLFHKMPGEIYAERGRTYHLCGDWNGAIADYRRALQAFSLPTNATRLTQNSYRCDVLAWLDELVPAA